MKPHPKKEMAISTASDYFISVYATPDAAEELKEFGDLLKTSNSSLYFLFVDKRYDTNEIIEWIRNY